MWLFKRRAKDVNIVPEEVQQFYQAERRERVGVAWLLALATLVVTVLVALGLFWGGRWTYRKLANKDSKPTPEQVTQNPQTNPETQTAPETAKAPTAKIPPAVAPTPVRPPVTAPAPQPARTPRPVTTPSSDLPNTGPVGTATAFVATTLIATVLYQLRLRRKQNS